VPEPTSSRAPLTPADALGVAAATGVHRISIPIPWPLRQVNVYLIEGDPLTLLDTGPNWGTALDALERGLAAHGYRVEDLELIVLSHQHADHLGLAEILVERSGARVACLDLLADFLGELPRVLREEDDFAADLLRGSGLDEDLVVVLRSAHTGWRHWGCRTQADVRLHDRGRVRMGGREWHVRHLPGHSPTDTVLWDPERGLALAGDHLIGHISSNPVVHRPLDPTGERPQALLAYINSMRITRELDLRIVLPGHGEPVTEHAALIDERLRMHGERAERFLEHLGDEPRTPFELARAMWGRTALEQPLLTLSEVYGHMDLLATEGRVRELPGSVVRFVAL
jgi:glyoxylase-like metal-dependent hydrolase (beta-lactamase superfamily II)